MYTVRAVAFLVLAVAAAGAAGCLTIAKQAFHEAVGAQGEFLPIRELSPSALARYRSVEFKPASTTVGDRICPPELLRAYDRSLARLAASLRAEYPGGEPGLVVDSEVLYFQRKGLLGGALMLTRVRLRCAEELVLDGLLRAESDAFRAGGEPDLAQASADALGKLLVQPKRSERANVGE